MGLFTKEALCPGDFVGEYLGVKISLKTSARRKSNYYFDIRHQGRVVHVLDGTKCCNSSFVRYVNAADCFKQQNCKFIQRNYRIYLVVIKPVQPNSELLSWYGKKTLAIVS